MNYKWKINKMVVSDDGTETVIGAAWECHGIVDELNLISSGFETLAPNDGKTFIKYANLTENIVVDWVKQSLGTEKVVDVEKTIAANYVKRSQITSKNNLPWE